MKKEEEERRGGKEEEAREEVGDVQRHGKVTTSALAALFRLA
jgi:hypothetical protein